MKDPALASSSRLGGAVISDRVVASLLEELTNGRYACLLYTSPSPRD